VTGNIAHTDFSYDASMEIDLGSDHCVDFVTVWGRPKQDNPQQIYYASFLLLNAARAPLRHFANTRALMNAPFIVNTTKPANPGCLNARYFRIERSQGDAVALVLDEIEVWAGGINVALLQSATITMSSTAIAGSGCVDGTTLITSSYCQTGAGTFEWIEVDLGEEYCLDSATIFSRGSTHTYRQDGNNMTFLNEARDTIVGGVEHVGLPQQVQVVPITVSRATPRSASSRSAPRGTTSPCERSR
jgi:hypothetical protein